MSNGRAGKKILILCLVGSENKIGKDKEFYLNFSKINNERLVFCHYGRIEKTLIDFLNKLIKDGHTNNAKIFDEIVLEDLKGLFGRKSD